MSQTPRNERKSKRSEFYGRLSVKLPWNRPKTPPIARRASEPDTANNPSDGDPNKRCMATGANETRATTPERISEPGLEAGHDGDAMAEPNNLWNEAFKSLKPATQAQLKAILRDGQDSIFAKPDFASLKAEVQQKQDRCEEEAWKITARGHVMIVRDFAAKSATWLQQIGDIVIPFAPQAASAPWGLIKGVLKITISYDHQMLALLTTMDEVLKVVYRGQIYEMIYTPEKTRDDVLQTLRAELQGIYKSALELIAYTQDQLSRGTGKRIIEAVVNPENADGFLKDLEARHIKLISAAQLCESVRSAEADSRLMSAMYAMYESSAQFQKKFESHFSEMEWKKMIKFLKAISPIPYTTHHQEYQEKRTSGTCNWLLQDYAFLTWENTSSPAVFWLWAGVGKSFLTSMAIDHLKNKLERSPNHEGLAFFYCRRARGEEERSRPLSVLQSFLRQLACYLGKPGLVQLGLVKAAEESNKVGGSFSRTTCEALLLESFNLYSCTTLVIDALDECDSASRDELVEFLGNVGAQASKPVKIFISSRPDDDIKGKFVAGLNIGVDASITREDMRLFIDQRLQGMMRKNPAIAKFQDEIRAQLFAKCDGMFQWTHLQLEQLRTCRTPESIDARLKSLPSGLKETYDEIYDRIKSQDDLSQQLVDRAVMWVMCAATPLTSKELLSAIRIDAKEKSLQLSSEITEEDLLFFCQHLLVTDPAGYWKVCHLSVLEYFEKHHWTTQEANLHVGNACLLILLDMPDPKKNLEFDDISTDLKDTATENMSQALSLHASLQRYVLLHWWIHVRALNNSQMSQLSSMTVLLVKFLGSPAMSSDWYRFWLQRISARTPRGFVIPREPLDASIFHDRKTIESLSPHNLPLLGVCRLGIYTALGAWWDNIEGCLEQANSQKHGLVQLAVQANCIPICDRLLDAGAPVDLASHGSSLQDALSHGNVELARLLFTKNRFSFDWLIQQHSFLLVITRAFRRSNRRIVQFFCSEEGFDVNTPLRWSTGRGSLLDLVIQRQEPKIVKDLIECGAHVNLALENGVYGSALAMAAYVGPLQIVELLLQAGADINLPLKHGMYGSALAAAACSEFNGLNTVKYLVGRGAMINLPLNCGSYGSALAAASAFNNLDTVNFLLDSGGQIDLPLRCGDYGSALAVAASSYCNRQMVECLVNRGADVNLLLKSGIYGSALAAAVAAHSVADNMCTIDYLIENGAEVDIRLEGGSYGSALSAAAAAPYVSMDLVPHLLSCGADGNLLLKSGDYGSALVAASSHNNSDVVEYLIEKGADVNSSWICGDFGSPLAAAAYFGNDKCVELLIKAGARVNAELNNSRFSNAIEAAEAELSEEELDRCRRAGENLKSRLVKKKEISALFCSMLDAHTL